MAADAGAQQIYDLLNQEAPSLKDELAEISRATTEARDNPYGVMSQSGVDAVANVRQFYRGLRNQIAAIETVDEASKAAALKALDTLDISFGAYERGLELGISRPAVPKVKNAARKARQAEKVMRGSIAGLAR